jgi:hypothetical protein
MANLRAKYGIGNDSRWKWEVPIIEKEQQMTLF